MSDSGVGFHDKSATGDKVTIVKQSQIIVHFNLYKYHRLSTYRGTIYQYTCTSVLLGYRGRHLSTFWNMLSICCGCNAYHALYWTFISESTTYKTITKTGIWLVTFINIKSPTHTRHHDIGCSASSSSLLEKVLQTEYANIKYKITFLRSYPFHT